MHDLAIHRVMQAAVVMAVLLFSGASHAAKEVAWNTLLPQLPALEDPLAHLTVEQQGGIETIAWVRALNDEDKGLDIYRQLIADAQEYESEFKAAKLDIDDLVWKYRNWQLALAKRQKRVNESS